MIERGAARANGKARPRSSMDLGDAPPVYRKLLCAVQEASGAGSFGTDKGYGTMLSLLWRVSPLSG